MTAPIPLRDRTLGDIATSMPGATAVFRRFHLDFCCGGDVALHLAADRKGLNAATIEQALGQLETDPGLAVPAETGALIDHILARYHETHRRELPELITLARKVEAVHRGDPAAPAGLAALLEEASDELERHMQKEEMILFPALRRGGTRVIAPIAQMRREHGEHGDVIRQIERLTHHFLPPDNACRSWRALYAGAWKFVDDLMEHVSLENNRLFPRFE